MKCHLVTVTIVDRICGFLFALVILKQIGGGIFGRNRIEIKRKKRMRHVNITAVADAVAVADDDRLRNTMRLIHSYRH